MCHAAVHFLLDMKDGAWHRCAEQNRYFKKKQNITLVSLVARLVFVKHLLIFQLDKHVKWIKITKNYKLLAINDSGIAEVVP